MATSKKAAAAKKPAAKKTQTVNKKPAGKKPAGKRPATKGAAPLVTSTQLSEQLGVKLTRRLDTPGVRKLRKALPGYVNLLDDAATLLEADIDLLNLRDVTPDGLRDVQTRQKYLSAREGVVEAVYRSIYEQRLKADDEGMGMLLKLARRIESAAEDDPDVRVRWKSVLDFLSKFRVGGGAASPAKEEADGA